MELSPEQKKEKLKKLASLKNDSDLVIFNEIADVKELLNRPVEPPVVNVEAPIVNVPAPVVNVPAPVVNVPAPVVNVPAPVVNVPAVKMPPVEITLNNEKSEKLLIEIKDTLQKEKPLEEKPTRENPLPVELIWDKKPYKGIGGGSPSGIFMGAATDSKLDELKSAIQNIGGTSPEDTLTASSGGYDYYGYAPVGTATSAAGWQICRYDSSGNKRFADATSTYSKVWDSRATYTYLN